MGRARRASGSGAQGTEVSGHVSIRRMRDREGRGFESEIARTCVNFGLILAFGDPRFNSVYTLDQPNGIHSKERQGVGGIR